MWLCGQRLVSFSRLVAWPKPECAAVGSLSRWRCGLRSSVGRALLSGGHKFNLPNTIGVRCIIGSRPYQEDRFKYEVIERPNGGCLYYFAVFDGHAGETTADYLSRNLHLILTRVLSEDGEATAATDELLSEAFRRANDEVDERSAEENWRSGSTASVLLVDLERQELVVGHVGDSRIVLASGGRGVPLTPEHTPYTQGESERVLGAGGSVVVGPDGVSRLCGLLTVTRAFGDLQLRQYGLIGEPWIARRAIDVDRDSFVVLATDGLFGLVTSQEACDIVKRARSPAHAAELLVDEAELQGTDDNTTCIVVPLYAWAKHRHNDYTQLLRRFKVGNVFGSAISELPPCLAERLAEGNVRKRDLIHKIWSTFDLDGDGALTPDEVMQGLRRMGARPSHDELERIFAIAASSECGRISLQDFWRAAFQQELIDDDEPDAVHSYS